MALENFLWEFGAPEDKELFKKKQDRFETDGTFDVKDMDMLRNVEVNILILHNSPI